MWSERSASSARCMQSDEGIAHRADAVRELDPKRESGGGCASVRRPDRELRGLGGPARVGNRIRWVCVLSGLSVRAENEVGVPHPQSSLVTIGVSDFADRIEGHNG